MVTPIRNLPYLQLGLVTLYTKKAKECDPSSVVLTKETTPNLGLPFCWSTLDNYGNQHTLRT